MRVGGSDGDEELSTSLTACCRAGIAGGSRRAAVEEVVAVGASKRLMLFRGPCAASNQVLD